MQWIKNLPHRGKGELKKIASFLGVHSSMLSQIFKGDSNLSLEQAQKISEYFGLENFETEYFLGLVQWERAGTKKLKDIIHRQLLRLKEMPRYETETTKAVQLSGSDRSTFYSAWFYSAIRLLTAIPQYDDAATISKYFEVPRPLVDEVLEFLLSAGLCVKKGNTITMGPRRTHLEGDYQARVRHHTNWRVKALARIPTFSPSEEFFSTFPMTLTESEAKEVKQALFDVLSRVETILDRKTTPEKLYCLNIDWFKF